MKFDLNLISSKNYNLKTTFFTPQEYDNLPCVILLHGFKGFRKWGYNPYLCEQISEKGFNVISFDFSHNGTGDDGENFTQPDKFADNTISLEVEETGDIINSYLNGEFEFIPTNKNIALIGISRGGAISIIRAAEDKRVTSLVTLASISFLDRYTERQKSEWEKNGFLEITNTRTNQVMKLNRVLLADIIHNKERFNLLKRYSELIIPKLIIHGDLDLTVPVKEAFDLYNSNSKNTEIKILEKANHTFNITHPFTETNELIEKIIEHIVSFLKKNLIR